MIEFIYSAASGRDGLEFGSWFPLGPFGAVGDFGADFKEDSRVIDGAGEVPIRFYFIARFVVIVFEIFVVFALAEIGGFARILAVDFVEVKSGHTDFGEFEMVGSIIKAFLRTEVGANRSILFFSGCSDQIVEC